MPKALSVCLIPQALFIVTILVSVMTTGSAFPGDPGQLLSILVAREHARADALIRKERRALDSLRAPDFIEVNSLGRFERNSVLDTLFPLLNLRIFTINDPHLQVMQDSETAVLTYRCFEELDIQDGRKIKDCSM